VILFFTVLFYILVVSACLVTALNFFLLLTISKIMLDRRSDMKNRKSRRDNDKRQGPPPGLVDITTPPVTYADPPG
jgi:hypothetical protein